MLAGASSSSSYDDFDRGYESGVADADVIYGYDSAGGDGQPCVDDDCTSLFVPSQLATGKSVYNVFPLSSIKAITDEEIGDNEAAPGAVAAVPASPFALVLALQPAQPVATPNE